MDRRARGLSLAGLLTLCAALPTALPAAAAEPEDGLVVFDSNQGAGIEIYVVNPDGSNLTQLTDSPGEDREPVWAPVGSRIAFQSTRDLNQEIYSIHPDGSDGRNLTNNPANDVSPTWSPDGLRIAFNSDRDGDDEIWVMDADGSNQGALTNNPAGDTKTRLVAGRVEIRLRL